MNSSKKKLNSEIIFIFHWNPNTHLGVFGYRLFCWNWKIIAESTIDCKNKLNSKIIFIFI